MAQSVSCSGAPPSSGILNNSPGIICVERTNATDRPSGLTENRPNVPFKYVIWVATPPVTGTVHRLTSPCHS